MISSLFLLEIDTKAKNMQNRNYESNIPDFLLYGLAITKINRKNFAVIAFVTYPVTRISH